MIPQHLDAISLNNLAIRSLEINEISCACEFIGIAIKLIENQNGFQSPSTRQKSQFYSQRYSFQWSNASSLPTQIADSQDPIGFFLFKRGMYIFDLHKNRDVENTNILSADIRAAISYNAALIFQLFAIGENNISLLSKAGDLYRLSQKILRKANERGIKSTLCFSFFFHVPLLNNLGQLCYELVDYQSSEYYFNRIQKQLHQLIASSSCSIASLQGKTNKFYHNDLLKMLSNTIVEIPTLAPAA